MLVVPLAASGRSMALPVRVTCGAWCGRRRWGGAGGWSALAGLGVGGSAPARGTRSPGCAG